jgi:hypothetical protein
MCNDQEEGVGEINKLAATIGMSHHTQERLYMLTPVVFFIAKVSWQHLRPVSIFFV